MKTDIQDSGLMKDEKMIVGFRSAKAHVFSKQMPTLTRREALSAIATATIGSFALANESRQRTGLGLVSYNCAIRRMWMQQQDPKVDLFEPLTFLIPMSLMHVL